MEGSELVAIKRRRPRNSLTTTEEGKPSSGNQLSDYPLHVSNGYMWQVSSHHPFQGVHSLFLTRQLKHLASNAVITGETTYSTLDHCTPAPSSILYPLFPSQAIIKPVKLLPLECRLL